VRAFEQNFQAASLGSSSAGYSRIWRYAHPDIKYRSMMIEAEALWKELEVKYNTTILHKTGKLDLARPGQPDFEEIL